ncbi:MAG: hypothetical protein NTY38_00875, partial [Acidobacteria bacterium]|nr:hypothetical protein [Acidobacteriota bacterium]
MRFEFYAYRFQFEALTAIYFPPGQSGNLIRGAFGTIFRRHACDPECKDTKSCEHRDCCPYAKIFEPVALETAPSGFADPPRPFVFRAAHLDDWMLEPGQRFHFDTHIFYPEEPGLIYFVTAFAELAEQGIGPGRGQARLVAVDQLNLSGVSAARVYTDGALQVGHVVGPNSLNLEPIEDGEVTRARVRFVTPTELKYAGEVIRRPEFGILFARIRDRVSTLRSLYGPGPLALDFRSMAERASGVRIARCDLNWVAVERHSSRTGQTQGVGGFVGE